MVSTNVDTFGVICPAFEKPCLRVLPQPQHSGGKWKLFVVLTALKKLHLRDEKRVFNCEVWRETCECELLFMKWCSLFESRSNLNAKTWYTYSISTVTYTSRQNDNLWCASWINILKICLEISINLQLSQFCLRGWYADVYILINIFFLILWASQTKFHWCESRNV